MITTSETLATPSPLMSPRMNEGLGAIVGDGGGGGRTEQIGGPSKVVALFGGVHLRSGLSDVFLQKHTHL